jgi:ribosomal protein S18 acetylase RimI-like enzyme
MQIRLALASDVPRIMELVRSVVPAMRAAGNHQWDDTYPNPAAFTRDIEENQLWVAEIDGALAGVAAITNDPGHQYQELGWDLSEPALTIHRLAVDPAFRGLGIASALMQHAENLALARNIAVLRVDTSAENQVTQRLFPKLGYTYSGEIALTFRPGLRVRCYEKRLPTT